MLAVDTNILVRFLTHDDPSQTVRAVALMKASDIWISKTVMLETAWVLRSMYAFAPKSILEAIRRIGGMPNVSFEDPRAVIDATTLYENGFDFADAMHLASRGESDEFVTFDARLVRRARTHSQSKVTLA
ncbi:MAG TPA: type II toxin-antitoxin system VapC family toxin [Bryobacteraceae bacterium]|nr:type II toxin-antitoxin system VapC family toxin [Bryobacteraceae bacterium]